MPTVEELLGAFRAAYLAGEAADPQTYLAQVEGTERRALAVAIDAYLEDAPAPEYASFATFAAADPLAQRIQHAVETWPALLPASRDAAGLKRSSLVAQLAQLLGVGNQEAKVGDYYHRMETGTLAPQGVSQRVYDALARLLDVSADRLRAAGERTLPPPAAAGGAAPVFMRARKAIAPAAPAPMADMAAAPQRDEVDELFTGGS